MEQPNPPQRNRWTSAEIPDQSGRVAVVTGANSGLGLEVTRVLAERGASVVLAVRDLNKGGIAVEEIRATLPKADLRLQLLDLASLTSVREAVASVEADHGRVDLLINNAGVMYTPKLMTADGFEMQFGTNHLGHFAFTVGLLGRSVFRQGSRIVTVSSVGHRILSKIDLDTLGSERRYSRVAAYGRSKLANLLFTYELDKRLTESGLPTSALAAHPGASSTDLGQHIPGSGMIRRLLTPVIQDAAMGALPTLRAATDPEASGGQYYGPGGRMEIRGNPVLVSSNTASHDPDLQRGLWEASESLTGLSFPA